MAVKDYIAQVRAKLTDEQLSEVGSVLKSIENEAEELAASLSAANRESKERKIKLREMNEKIEIYELDLENWKKQADEFKQKIDNPEYKDELEQLRSFKTSYFQKQRESFLKSWEQISQHPKFEKAKHKFVLPEETEDGLAWDKLPDDAMEKNITVLNDLNELEYFATENGKPTPSPVKGQSLTDDNFNPENLKSVNDVEKAIEAWQNKSGF